MATMNEVTRIVTDLAGAYPNYNAAKLPGVLKFYLDALKNYPAVVIEKAVGKLVQESKWFPTVAELITACHEVMDGMSDAQETDTLRAQAFRLEQEYYSTGTLDPVEWEQLASQFTAAGRYDAAVRVRERVDAYHAAE